MPQRTLRECKHTGCHKLSRSGYCPQHQAEQQAKDKVAKAIRGKQYDKTRRNKDSTTFYKSAAWRLTREKVLIRDNYLCQECLRYGINTFCNIVDHIKELQTHPELALDMNNLTTKCSTCHSRRHMAETNKKRAGMRVGGHHSD